MLIGLTGRMGSGKDTVVERLRAVTAPNAITRKAFADPLKDSVCALFGITRETLERMKNSRHAEVTLTNAGDSAGAMQSMRTFLQRYGTEAHRDIFGKNFWLDATLPINYAHAHTITVITDCRFPNEAERVKVCGGYVFEVIGPLGKMDANSPHESERPLPESLLHGEIFNACRDDNFKTLDYSLRVLLESLKYKTGEANGTYEI